MVKGLDTVRSSFPTAMRGFCKTIGLSTVIKSSNEAMVDWDHLSSRKVEQLIGAFFMVKRLLFDNLGGFDERFFVYYEEVDFVMSKMFYRFTFRKIRFTILSKGNKYIMNGWLEFME